MKKKAILFMFVLMFISTNAFSQETISGYLTEDLKSNVPVEIYRVNCGSDVLIDVAIQRKVDGSKRELLKDLNLLKVNGKIILRRNNYGHA